MSKVLIIIEAMAFYALALITNLLLMLFLGELIAVFVFLVGCVCIPIYGGFWLASKIRRER